MMPTFSTVLSRRLRTDRERGYIGVMVLCIIVLLIATSVALFTSTKAGVDVSRHGMANTQARDAVNDADATAIAAFNALPATYNPTTSAPPSSPTSWSRPNGQGIAGWYYTPSSLTLTSTGVGSALHSISSCPSAPAVTVPTGCNVEAVPLRWRTVASQTVDTTNKAVVYGIPANGTSTGFGAQNGTWADGIAVSQSQADGSNSTVEGKFYGTSNGAAGYNSTTYPIGVYGSTLSLSVQSGGTANVIGTKYSNNAAISGSSVTTQRDAITAQYDRVLLANKITTSGYGTGSCPSALVSALSSGTRYCLGTTTTGALTAPPSGVATVVVNGNLTISGNISAASSGQIHFYVTGSVTFASSGTLTLGNTFIYAPSGSCTTSSTSTVVQYSGAMTCLSAKLTNTANTFTYVPPLGDADFSSATPAWTNASSRVFYTEEPGYADARTQ